MYIPVQRSCPLTASCHTAGEYYSEIKISKTLFQLLQVKSVPYNTCTELFCVTLKPLQCSLPDHPLTEQKKAHETNLALGFRAEVSMSALPIVAELNLASTKNWLYYCTVEMEIIDHGGLITDITDLLNHLTILSCSRLFCFFSVAISAIPLTTAGLRETYIEKCKTMNKLLRLIRFRS